MAYELKYVELKTGYSDNGPAWIGKVKTSKSGNTLYFNDKAFLKSNGTNSNFYDIESREKYWISGIKKDGSDRHWAGNGKIMIDRKVIPEYLAYTGKSNLDMHDFIIVEIEDIFPIERINNLNNALK